MNKNCVILELMKHFVENNITHLPIQSNLFYMYMDGYKTTKTELFNNINKSQGQYILRRGEPSASNKIGKSLFGTHTILSKYSTGTEINLMNHNSLCIDVSDEESLFQYSTVLEYKELKLLEIARDIRDYDSVQVMLFDNYSTEVDEKIFVKDLIEEYNRLSRVPYTGMNNG